MALTYNGTAPTTINYNGTSLNIFRKSIPGYQVLDYIQSSGSQQIDTGVTFNMNSDECWVDFQSTVLNQNGMIFANGNTTNHFWFYHYQDGNGIQLYVQNSGSQSMIGGASRDLNRHTFSWKSKQNIYDGQVIGTDSRSLGTTNSNIFLFSWGGQYYWSGRIYGCKIWKSGTLTRNFVPAKRDSDGVIGLYETVTNSFYTNSGSGSFTTVEYEHLDYIQATGSQYIDTGFSTTTGMKCVYKANWQGTGYVVGSHNPGSPYGRNGCYLHSAGVDWEFGYGETCPGVRSSYGANLNQDYIVDCSTTYNNAYMKVNGETIATGSGQYTSGLTVKLFVCEYNMSLRTSAKLYYCKIWNSSDVLVRDLVPVRRKSDSAIGMFDNVTGNFYGNSGSGTFTAGTIEGNGYNVWSKPYSLSISQGSNTSVSVIRYSSRNQQANLGTLSNGSLIYYGDELRITYSVSSGYNIDAHTVNGITFDSGSRYTVTSAISVVTSAVSATSWHTVWSGSYASTATRTGSSTGWEDDYWTLTFNASGSLPTSIRTGVSTKITGTATFTSLTTTSSTTGQIPFTMSYDDGENGADIYISSFTSTTWSGKGSSWAYNSYSEFPLSKITITKIEQYY